MSRPLVDDLPCPSDNGIFVLATAVGIKRIGRSIEYSHYHRGRKVYQCAFYVECGSVLPGYGLHLSLRYAYKERIYEDTSFYLKRKELGLDFILPDGARPLSGIALGDFLPVASLFFVSVSRFLFLAFSGFSRVYCWCCRFSAVAKILLSPLDKEVFLTFLKRECVDSCSKQTLLKSRPIRSVR